MVRVTVQYQGLNGKLDSQIRRIGERFGAPTDWSGCGFGEREHGWDSIPDETERLSPMPFANSRSSPLPSTISDPIEYLC